MIFKKNQDQRQIQGLSDSDQRSYTKIALFLILPMVLIFYALGSYQTLASHEAYAVVPAQEMLESGDWVVPRFGGVPRLKKPPLSYWVIAATGKITGLGVNELTARLPAAISAVLLSILIGFWAKKWYGKQTGYVACFIQATSLYIIMFGRKAEIDMMLCLFTTSALFLLANSEEAETKKQHWVRWTAIYGLISLAWLAKFHYSLAIILGPSILYFLIQKRYRTILRFINPAGFILLGMAAFVWPYLVLKQLPNASEIWFDETVGRALGTKGTDPFWFYIPFLCWMTLPWTPLAFWGGFQSFTEAWKQGNSRERFLWIWFFTVLFIVSIQPVKHSHYLMGCLPVFSLLAARPAVKLFNLLNRNFPLLTPFQTIGIFLTWAIMGICAALILPIKWPLLEAPAQALGGIFIIGGFFIAYFLQTNHPIRGFYTMTLTVLACFITTYGWIMPMRDHRTQSVYYAKTVRNHLPEGQQLSSFQIGMDPIIYYLDSPVNRLETIGEIEKELEEKKRLTLIAHRSGTHILKNFGTLRVLHYFQVKHDYIMPKEADWVVVELKRKQRSVQLAQKKSE